MGMSVLYGPADEDESIATIHAALETGISLLDTGDYYGEGHNELLLGEALRGRDRESMFLSVKFGVLRAPGGAIPKGAAAGERYDARQMAILDSELS